MEKKMSFIEILESEHYWIVEALEHGSSDPAVTLFHINLLEEKTGWRWEV